MAIQVKKNPKAETCLLQEQQKCKYDYADQQALCLVKFEKRLQHTPDMILRAILSKMII